MLNRDMATVPREEKAVPIGKAELLLQCVLQVYGSLSLVLALSACNGDNGSGTAGGNPSPSPPPPSSIAVKLDPITLGLSAPVFMTAPPGDPNRLFIVEQGGTIQIFNVPTGSLLPTPFLDLSGSITSGGERGLLGFAVR